MGSLVDPDAVLSCLRSRLFAVELPAAIPIKFEVTIGNTFYYVTLWSR